MSREQKLKLFRGGGGILPINLGEVDAKLLCLSVKTVNSAENTVKEMTLRVKAI